MCNLPLRVGTSPKSRPASDTGNGSELVVAMMFCSCACCAAMIVLHDFNRQILVSNRSL